LLSKEYEVKGDELTSFRDQVTTLVNERDDQTIIYRRKKDDLKKSQVCKHQVC
jgi:hypothetical protein